MVDASVALAWCLKDEEDAYADAMLRSASSDGALAPAHWPLEVANGLLVAERRGRVEPAGVRHATALLERVGVHIAPVELTTAMWSVLDVARDEGLSIYDAAYLDLARFKGASLATLDERLRAACAQMGVAVASPES